jgi:UDP-N-acetylglucosamine 2-epimerase (non-hydrolysing)
MILAVIGTRPEVIKMAPVVAALRRRHVPVEVVATGQHHDVRMMGAFLDCFGLRVDHPLGLQHRDLLGSFVDILSALGQLFTHLRPELALAVGDTTTVLATAFAARKTGGAFGHIEAGLRAFSRELPEEEHRICADAVGELLFAPTRIASENLAREHVNGRILHTGNPVLDALRMHPPAACPRAEREGILVTVHRQETVDDPERLAQVLAALETLAAAEPVEWPLHPRTRAKIAEHRLAMPRRVRLSEPLGHREFLDRLVRARVVVTDSGGVQEEAAILGTPCVCVRNHTERPETIDAGVSLLAGVETAGILEAADEILGNWDRFARPVPQLYGDGRAGDKIASACLEFLAERASTCRPLERLAGAVGK